VKNESRFSTAKSISFYSEFNADSEYIILFEKFFGRENGLIATCPSIVPSIKRRAFFTIFSSFLAYNEQLRFEFINIELSFNTTTLNCFH
jgi:hypothetical protein